MFTFFAVTNKTGARINKGEQNKRIVRKLWLKNTSLSELNLGNTTRYLKTFFPSIPLGA
jgi:hypothetical protein